MNRGSVFAEGPLDARSQSMSHAASYNQPVNPEALRSRSLESSVSLSSMSPTRSLAFLRTVRQEDAVDLPTFQSTFCQLVLKDPDCTLVPTLTGIRAELSSLESLKVDHNITLTMQDDGSAQERILFVEEQLSCLNNPKITTLLLLYNNAFSKSIEAAVRGLKQYMSHLQNLIVQVVLFDMEMVFVYDLEGFPFKGVHPAECVSSYIKMIRSHRDKIDIEHGFGAQLYHSMRGAYGTLKEAMIVLPRDFDKRHSTFGAHDMKRLHEELSWLMNQPEIENIKFRWGYDPYYSQLQTNNHLLSKASTLLISDTSALVQSFGEENAIKNLIVEGREFVGTPHEDVSILSQNAHDGEADSMCHFFENALTHFPEVTFLAFRMIRLKEVKISLNFSKFPKLNTLELADFALENTSFYLTNARKIPLLKVIRFNSVLKCVKSQPEIESIEVIDSCTNKYIRRFMKDCMKISITENTIDIALIESCIQQAISLCFIGMLKGWNFSTTLPHVVDLEFGNSDDPNSENLNTLLLQAAHFPSLLYLKCTGCRVRLKGVFKTLKKLVCVGGEFIGDDPENLLEEDDNELNEDEEFLERFHVVKSKRPFVCPNLEELYFTDFGNVNQIVFDTIFAPKLRKLFLESKNKSVSLPMLSSHEPDTCFFPHLEQLMLRCDSSTFSEHSHLLEHFRMTRVNVLIVDSYPLIPRFDQATFYCHTAIFNSTCISQTLGRKVFARLDFQSTKDAYSFSDRMPKVTSFWLNGHKIITQNASHHSDLSFPSSNRNCFDRRLANQSVDGLGEFCDDPNSIHRPSAFGSTQRFSQEESKYPLDNSPSADYEKTQKSVSPPRALSPEFGSPKRPLPVHAWVVSKESHGENQSLSVTSTKTPRRFYPESAQRTPKRPTSEFHALYGDNGHKESQQEEDSLYASRRTVDAKLPSFPVPRYQPRATLQSGLSESGS